MTRKLKSVIVSELQNTVCQPSDREGSRFLAPLEMTPEEDTTFLALRFVQETGSEKHR